MIIVKVKFIDWNNVEHIVEVTSDMCEALKQCKNDIDLIVLAYKYIARRYPEMYNLISIKIVAK